ncbi:MAG TPA: hypothetical protein PK876_00735 [Elusimicrobiota bacterium]|nr:hypothetical protein [Elusimicrobiota bacterium]
MTKPSIENDFARFAGQVAESLSFNKSIGQIYGLLYTSPDPISLDEIATQLMMSKGNASINLRILEEWGAVRPVSVSGSRRDHYEANRNIKEVAMRRVEDGFSKRLEWVERELDRFLEQSKGSTDPKIRKQLEELKSLAENARRVMKMLPKIAGFFGG